MANSGMKKETLTAEKFNIKSLVNCVRHGDSFEDRRGFFAKPEDFIFKIDGSEAFDMSFITTDCYLFLDGKYGRVAVNIADNLMDSITYNIMLVCVDKTTIPLGKINFTTSGGAMGFPDSFAVFSGKANQGAGIYLISRRLYDEDYPDMISVRELSSDRKNWILLTESLIYTPLILVNGRGEAYHNAEVSGRALNLPAPKLFESKNMLNPRFKAAYTTDGASYGFSLPFLNIDNTSVVADLFYKGQKYKLQITGTATESPSVLIESAEVVMNVDRGEGRVYFTLKSGGYWAPEFTGGVNNLCFTAYKTVKEHIKMVGAVSASQRLEGEVTLFYKSATEPSCVLINSPIDPLYFPESTASMLGSEATEVCKTLQANGNIFAFKEGEIYSSKIKAYTPNKKTVNLLGLLYETDEYELNFKKAATFPGDPIAKTIKEINGEILFQTKDSAVWKLKASNGTSLFPEKIGQLSEVYSFALSDKDRYMLIKDKRAIVYEKTKDEYLTAEWSLPEKAVGGFSYAGKTLFLFEYRKDSVYMIYPAEYGSEKDIKLVSPYLAEEFNIKSDICIEILKGKENPKRIFKITASGEGGVLEFELSDGEKKVVKRRARFKNGFAEFYPAAVVKKGYVKLSFCKPMKIDRITTLYKSKEVK